MAVEFYLYPGVTSSKHLKKRWRQERKPLGFISNPGNWKRVWVLWRNSSTKHGRKPPESWDACPLWLGCRFKEEVLHSIGNKVSVTLYAWGFCSTHRPAYGPHNHFRPMVSPQLLLSHLSFQTSTSWSSSALSRLKVISLPPRVHGDKWDSDFAECKSLRLCMFLNFNISKENKTECMWLEGNTALSHRSLSDNGRIHEQADILSVQPTWRFWALHAVILQTSNSSHPVSTRPLAQRQKLLKGILC